MKQTNTLGVLVGLLREALRSTPNLKSMSPQELSFTRSLMRSIGTQIPGMHLEFFPRWDEEECRSLEILKALLEKIDVDRPVEADLLTGKAFGRLFQPAGGRTVSRPVAKIEDLTPREIEVLTLVADGNTNKDIATRLGVGTRTVETHRERVMRKLDIHTAAGLTKFAIVHELIKLQ